MQNKTMPNWDDKVTARQAYLAMYEYLARYDDRSPSEEIQGMLGSASLLEDGGSADPAVSHDFLESLAAVLDGTARDARLHLG